MGHYKYISHIRNECIWYIPQGEPSIDTKGKYSISHRLDREISNVLNAPGAFSGEIINRANIGKTSDELVALWNAEHADDPVD